jgi:hypothetical protein
MPSANQIHGVAAASGEHLSRFWLNQARFSELKQPVSAGGDPDCPKSEKTARPRHNDCVLDQGCTAVVGGTVRKYGRGPAAGVRYHQ